jgi:hypothetical protein
MLYHKPVEFIVSRDFLPMCRVVSADLQRKQNKEGKIVNAFSYSANLITEASGLVGEQHQLKK